MGEAMYDEHRRYRRCAIKGDVFIGSEPLYHTVGSLKDISEGGIGFEYVSSTDSGQSRTVEVDIICGKHLRLSRIPCKVSYDIRIDRRSSYSTGKRRCGLEFGRLSHEQDALLSLILSSCA
jgi:hypothetical protein